MHAAESVRLALAQLRAQKLKSSFSVVGVVIGIMFLMIVVSVIEGMNRYMEDDFARKIYGLNTLTLRRTPSIQLESTPSALRGWARRPRLTTADANAIREQLETPALTAITFSGRGKIRSEAGRELENVHLIAASADYFRIRDVDLERGRVFTPPEDRLGVPVIVLGSETAAQLAEAHDPLDREVRIAGLPFRVIGILREQGSLLGVSVDNVAIAPASSTLGRMLRESGNTSILIRTPDESSLRRAQYEIEAIMRVRHRLRPTDPNTFEIETAEDSMEFWTTISRILYLAFPLLVGISLIVGGIVIMNIMLISILERTREIGIRMAVGARRRDITMQILIEGATLSGTGALAGIALGTGIAKLIAAVSPLPAAIAPVWIGVSIILGMGVGIIACLYPATRAARLDPVVALRSE